MVYYGYIGYDVSLSEINPAQVCLIVSPASHLPDYIRDYQTNQIFKICAINEIVDEAPSAHMTTMLQHFLAVNVPLTQFLTSLDCDAIAACFVSNESVSYHAISDVINAISHTSYSYEVNLSGNYMFPDSYEHALEVLQN